MVGNSEKVSAIVIVCREDARALTLENFILHIPYIYMYVSQAHQKFVRQSSLRMVLTLVGLF